MGNYIGANQQPPADATTPITGSLSANGNLLSNVDTTGYNSISIQISGIWTAEITFQTSNNGTDWVNIQGYAFNSTIVATDTVVDNDIYILPVIGKYLQVVVSNYLSGTIVATAYLRNQSLAGIGEASLTQAMDQATGNPINIGFQGFQGPGPQNVKNSFPVSIANEQVNDFIGLGCAFMQGNSLSLNANILNAATNNPAPIDCAGYRGIAIQIVGIGITTTSSISCQLESSNDGVVWTSNYMIDAYYGVYQTSSGGVGTYLLSFPTSTTTPAVGSTGYMFIGNIYGRYLRLRATSAGGSLTGGGTSRLTYRLSTTPYPNLVGAGNTSVSNITSSGLSYLSGYSIPLTGASAGNTYPGLQTAGFSTAYTKTAGPLNNNPISVRNVTDPLGAQTVSSPGPLEAENYNTTPLTVRLDRTTAGQDSVQDLLQQMLLEIKAINYYLRELPMAISSLNQTPNPELYGNPPSMQDEPENFASDARNDMNVRGH